MGRVGDVFSPPLDDLRKIPIHFASLSQIAQVAGAIVAWEDVGALHTSSPFPWQYWSSSLVEEDQYCSVHFLYNAGAFRCNRCMWVTSATSLAYR